MATTAILSVTKTSGQAAIQALEANFNTTNYVRVLVATGTTPSDSLNPPSGIVGSTSAPASGTAREVGILMSGLSPGTNYTVNGYAQSSNNRYYPAGSASFRTLDALNPPTNISSSVNGRSVTLFWTKDPNAFYTGLDTDNNLTEDFKTTSSSYSTTMPSYSTPYTFHLRSSDANSTEFSSWTTYSFTTGAAPPPQPPTGVPSITNYFASRGHSLTVGFNSGSVSGQSGYRIYANGSLKLTVGSTGSYNFLIDFEYVNYTISVVPYNGDGEGSAAQVSVRSIDETSPNVSIISQTATNTTITLTVSGSDPPRGSGDGASGIQAYRPYLNGVSQSLTGSSTINFTGLTPGTLYTVGVEARDNDGNFSAQASRSVTTTNIPPPSGKPTITTRNANLNHTLTVNWTRGTVTGETGYKVYANSFLKETVVGASAGSSTFGIDFEWVDYTVKVAPYSDEGGDGNEFSEVIIRSHDETAPTVSITSATVDGLTITMTVSGTDSPRGSGDGASGINEYWFYLDNVLKGTINNLNNSYTFTELEPSTTYTVGVRAVDFEDNQSAISSTTRTTPARPTNFAWTNAKVAGQPFNVTAAEWNAFTAKINEFRSYAKLAAVSFPTYAAGQTFTAAAFNSAISAISPMSPSTPPPSTVTAGTSTITAAGLNQLRDSLNSIP